MEILKTPRELVHLLHTECDTDFVLSHTDKLSKEAYGCTFDDHKKEVKYVSALLDELGFSHSVISFPADGEAVYQDMRSPLGWRATKGKLTVVKSPLPFEDAVVADFERMPYHLIKHSTAVKEGGVRTRLITEEQAYSGVDVRGAIVLLGSAKEARKGAIAPLLDLGAMGFVTDFLVAACDTPDELHWVNAATDGVGHWHCQCDDRDFVGFSVTPRVGKQLREAANAGEVEVLVECDGERYRDEIQAITALIPGESKEELWLTAHLYEPMPTDNSVGVIECIYAVKHILELVKRGVLPPLKYSIRMVFAMELYGLAAVTEYLGVKSEDNAIGGINLDNLPVHKNINKIKLIESPVSSGGISGSVALMGAMLIEEMFGEDYRLVGTVPTVSDDIIIGDRMIGIPSVWYASAPTARESVWHSSYGNMAGISRERLRVVHSLISLYIARMSTLGADTVPLLLDEAYRAASLRLTAEAESCKSLADRNARMGFFLEGERGRIRSLSRYCDSPMIEKTANALTVPTLTEVRPSEMTGERVWQDYAARIVPTRKTRGIPHDLARVPREERRALPDRMIYGAMSMIMSGCDGERSLEVLIREALYETRRSAEDKEFKPYVDAFFYLEKYGYVDCHFDGGITSEDIKDALIRLGVKKDDVLLLHSALSGCGNIVGGADALIDGFYEAVGEDGGVLTPAFTRPYLAFEGGVNKDARYRPYSPDNIAAIWTGATPKAMLKRPDSRRSDHATHSWAAIGKGGYGCLTHQRLLDPPVSESAPCVKAMEIGGKVAFFGCGVASNTFIHHFEYLFDCNFLENAVIKVVATDGRLRTEVIHKHVPGCRDFYSHKKPTSKFYLRALEKGLEIKEEPLGCGSIYLMDLKQLYEIGKQVFEEDPYVTLCDKEDCMFCNKYKPTAKK